ncbi:hypothetical protein BGI33_10555 [Snodgrassella alvi]|nr:hypothetical protein BGI33_10555 [Snodgrassella alvi]PIT17065.1 hypothetical protein BGI34_08555 [Snodgrassella alvi]
MAKGVLLIQVEFYLSVLINKTCFGLFLLVCSASFMSFILTIATGFWLQCGACLEFLPDEV